MIDDSRVLELHRKIHWEHLTSQGSDKINKAKKKKLAIQAEEARKKPLEIALDYLRKGGLLNNTRYTPAELAKEILESSPRFIEI